jgi:acyl-CoA thioesterase FadM
MDVVDIPFNRFVGLTPPTQPGAIFSLPADVKYTNHLGSVHASALLTLAEASSGEYLRREFGDLAPQVIPVVRRIEAKFRKPAHGALHSQVTVSLERKQEFLSTLASRGRALLEVQVDVRDEHDVHALTATVEWFVARKQ